jgi:hypothetical protein
MAMLKRNPMIFWRPIASLLALFQASLPCAIVRDAADRSYLFTLQLTSLSTSVNSVFLTLAPGTYREAIHLHDGLTPRGAALFHEILWSSEQAAAAFLGLQRDGFHRLDPLMK